MKWKNLCDDCFVNHAFFSISAPSSVSTKPFTPYSVKLNNSIHILHDALLATLEKEQTDLEKDKVVKVLL